MASVVLLVKFNKDIKIFYIDPPYLVRGEYANTIYCV